jgi:hypothetical protein
MSFIFGLQNPTLHDDTRRGYSGSECSGKKMTAITFKVILPGVRNASMAPVGG